MINKINAIVFLIAFIKKGESKLLIDLKITTAILHRKAEDNADKILKILSKSKSNEEKHIVLFNLPEALKA